MYLFIRNDNDAVSHLNHMKWIAEDVGGISCGIYLRKLSKTTKTPDMVIRVLDEIRT